METGVLGKVYEDGETLVRQGEPGDCLFAIQEGTVEILVERDGHETLLRTTGPGEVIGEMAIFEQEVRSATVRARGRVRALTVDKKNFLRRIHEDPSLAYRLVKTLSGRVRDLSRRLAEAERSA